MSSEATALILVLAGPERHGPVSVPLHNQLQNSIRIKSSGPSILISLYPTSIALSTVITNL